ncbi:pilus assembly PilX family protein [Psychromonas aquimarina]|uniref:pilus assembly PilX family protein n=1 Tax=Psychromonas aquimarina TaxID=444919 RepID=UPI00041BDBD8|nr:PilX N-terminal domain-containing pilus assembly protein [Psychromonas aquimarina]
MLKKQSGAALAVSLIILLVATVIVVSGSQSGALQEKMTVAVREAHISLEIAESGIKDAENVIDALTSTAGFNTSGTNGFYSQDAAPADIFEASVWGNAITAAAATTVSGQTARFFIEDQGVLPMPDEDLSGVNMTGYGQTTGSGDIRAFKIVSRSLGINGNSERIVVSYYGKRF